MRSFPFSAFTQIWIWFLRYQTFLHRIIMVFGSISMLFATFFSPIIPKITNNSFVSCSPARQCSSIKCWTTWYVFLWFVSQRPHECNETFPLCGLIACGCESDLIVVLVFAKTLCYRLCWVAFAVRLIYLLGSSRAYTSTDTCGNQRIITIIY